MYQISVIIPFFNTENYLEDCLKSVLQTQFFKSCEIILINDGSNDRSVEIAQKFANEYKNIAIYHYQNEGLSAARNHGMEYATGKYLFFLDSDDYIASDYLFKLYQKAEELQCDIVFAGFSRVTENKEFKRQVIRPILNCTQVMTGDQYLNQRMTLGDWHNEVWCALYKKEFLERNSLQFHEDINLYEDIIFTNEILAYAQRVYAIPVYGYMYRCRRYSLVQDGVKSRDVIAGIKVLDRLIYIYQSLEEEKKRFFGRVLFEHISMILYYIGQVNGLPKSRYYRQLKNPLLLKILRRSISTPKECIKYLIFRYAVQLYYPLVRKKVHTENE